MFERLGVPSEDAGIVSHHLVKADLRGVHSHGVIRVPTYATALKAGKINPTPAIEVVEDHGGQVDKDGNPTTDPVAARAGSSEPVGGS